MSTRPSLQRPFPFVALLCALLLAPSGASAGVYNVPALQDSWLKEIDPLTNRGSDAKLRAQTLKLDAQRPLLEFDTSVIPGTSYVLQALLFLSVMQPDGSGLPVDVREVTAPWSETTVTWASHATAYDSSMVWASFDPSVAGSVAVDVTSIVQRWVSGTKSNNGVALVPQSGTQSRYASREGGNPAEHPMLVVNTGAAALGVTDLAVANTVSDALPVEGASITYTVQVDNLGPALATGVEVTDLLPAGVTYVSHSASQGGYVPGTGVWIVNAVAANDSATLTVDVTVNPDEAGSHITNTAFVSARVQTDPDPSNDSADAVLRVQGGAFRISSGLYFGSGAAGFSIGAGFRPDLVLVKESGKKESVLATTSMLGVSKLPVSAAPPAPGLVVSLDPNGFTLGSDSLVNGSGKTFYWVAMRAASSEMVVGEYTGDGVDDRNIDRIGFQPGWVMVLGSGSTLSVQRFSSQAGDSTLPFDGGAALPDRIQLLQADGFQVGADPTVNSPGATYHFAAWSANPGQAAQGSYVGNNVDNRPVLDPGFLPDFVSVVRGTQDAVYRTAAMGLDQALSFNATSVKPDRVQAMLPLGFEVGKHGTVNSDSRTYHWIALADSTGPRADLAVTKTVDDATPDPNQSIIYTVSVTNNGPDDATGVQVTDLLPPDAAYQFSVPSRGFYSNLTGLWTVGSLAAGVGATLDITATVADQPTLDVFVNGASVTAVNELDPAAGNDSDSASVSVNGNDLQVTKTVDVPAPTEGDTIVFQVHVANAGLGTTAGIQVTDLLPAGLTYLADSTVQGTYDSGTGVWDIGSLAGGASADIFVSATVDPGTAGTALQNIAAVTAASRPDPVAANDAALVVVAVLSVDIQVTKTVDNPTPDEGDTVQYTVTVQNLGPDNATIVDVTDVLPAGLSYSSDAPSQGTYASGTGVWGVGPLNAGAAATLFLDADVDSAGQTIVNTATLTAVSPTDIGAMNDADSAQIVVSAADLRVTKTVDDSTPSEGDAIEFLIQINNAGPENATNVALIDLLPTGLTYASDSTLAGAYDGLSGLWSAGAIDAGDSAGLYITATVDPGTGGTTIINTAAGLVADQGDPNAGDNFDAVLIDVQAADLVVGKAVSDSTPKVGDSIVYTLTVGNGGPDPATNVQVTDLLPAGVTYQGHVTVGGSTYTPGTGVWTVPSLGVPSTSTLQITASVDAGTAGQTIVNTATRTGADQVDLNAANDSAARSITVQSADLGVTASVNDSTPNENDTVTFSVLVANAGPDSAGSVTLTDLLPAGVTYVSDMPGQGAYVPGTGTWTAGGLASGASATLDIAASVNPGTAGTVITNSVLISASTPGDPGAANDSAAVTISVQSADLGITKAVNNASPPVGSTVTYTVKVNNFGPDSATNVVLADSLPAGVTYQSASPDQGTYSTVTQRWSAGTIAAADSATLLLTATIDAGTAGQTITNHAVRVGADQTDTNALNDADSASVTVLVAVPASSDIAVLKTVDNSTPDEGDTVQFTVTLTNNGPDPGGGVGVTDLLPAGLTYSGHAVSQGTYAVGTGAWLAGTVVVGDTLTLDVSATVDPATAGATIVNTASVTAASQVDPNGANNADADSVTVRAADVSVTVVADTTALNEGATVTYTVAAQNSGPDGALGLVVTDLLPAGLTYQGDSTAAGSYDDVSGHWTIGSLPAATSVTLDVTATVDPGTAGTTLTDIAAVTARTRGDPDPSNDADTLAIAVDAVDIAVSTTVDVAAPDELATVTFTIAALNVGPDPATGVLIADLLPAGLTYQSDTPSQGSYGNGTGVWNVGPLGAGGSATLALGASVDAGTAGQTLTNTASLSGVTQADIAAGNDADSVAVTVRSADLTVSKTVDIPMPMENSAVRFTVTVANLGPDSTSGVGILDNLPAGLTYVADSVSVGSYNSGAGLWTVGGMAAGDSAGLVMTATVNPGTAGQTLWNTSSVSASSVVDPNGTNDADSVSVTVSQGVLIAGAQRLQIIQPGAADAELFTLAIVNTHSFAVTLDRLTFTNTTFGTGNSAELDAELGALTLYQDDGDLTFEPLQDFPLSSATAVGGGVTFSGLLFTIPQGAVTTFYVGTDAGITARDGDRLDLELQGPADVVFQEAVSYQNSWPVAPAGSATIDGMAAAQIGINALGSGTAFAGGKNVIVVDAVLPANGYAQDTLQELEITNAGTAIAGTDVSAVGLWSDGGDGVFDAGLGDDTFLGAPTKSAAASWRLKGLSAAIPVAGQRVFASVDLAPGATPGRTLQMEVPTTPTGVVVASTNDGPVDTAAQSGAVTISAAPSIITAGSEGQTGVTLPPGAGPVELFRFVLVNTGVITEELSSVTFTNTASGPGTQAELDAEWDSLGITVLTGIDGIGVGGLGRGAASSFSSGTVTFGGLGERFAAGDSVAIVLTGSASLAARDGDVLDVQVANAGDIVFTGSAQVTGSFPMDPAGQFPVDGMTAAQIGQPRNLLPANLLTGSTNNLSFVFDLYANGYEPDTLSTLNVRNAAMTNPAVGGTDIARVDLWWDVDADGTPEPNGDDAPGHLGRMVDTGNRWEITGLAHPVGLGGVRFFVTTDVDPSATLSTTLDLALPTSPDFGVGMASPNDGPVDLEVTSGTVQTISVSDRVTLGTATIPPGTANPGETGVVLLHLLATNDYTVPKTITGLSVTNRTSGPGSPANLDSEAGQLRLWADSTGGGALASAVFAGGTASFGLVSFPVAPGATRDLFVTSDVSLPLAADGDVLDARVTDENAVSFSDATTIVASWPLSSQAQWTVDGFLEAQITNHGAPPATLGPAEGPALALDMTLPSNGYSADVLQGLTVVNDSTAVPGDIDQLKIWRDGGDAAFDGGAGDDLDLGTMTPVGADWVSPLLADSIPAGGARYFVSVNSSPALVNGRTVKLAVPMNGVTMESGDDGPIDGRVENPNVITLSNSELLADIDISPNKSTAGNTVTATMTVRNQGDSTIVGITPSALVPDVPGVLSLLVGPLPDSLDLMSDSVGTFRWTYSSNRAGTVRLTGSASGTESGSGLTRQTLDATSDAHQVFLQASELQLFPVESMPFSVSEGQTGVVPLSLTFTNNAPPGGSDILITRLSFRLEEGNSAGIIPADVLQRVVVNEGTNVYSDKSSTLETTGDVVDLPLNLAQVLVAPDSGQVTLSISLDISDSTTVPEFRLQIPGGSYIDAEDATNTAPVTIALAPSESYPVESGLARVVSEATELDVDTLFAPPLTAGQGQDDVPLLDLRFLNPDPDSLAADVRVSTFEILLTDSSGAVIRQPSLYLERVRVTAPFQTLLDRAVTTADDSTIALALSPLLSAPVNSPVPVTIAADIATLAPLGNVQLLLADSSGFDARDAITGTPVPTIYQSVPMAGPVVSLVAPTDTVFASGTPMLPAQLPVGAVDQPALRIVLRHPGGAQTGPVALESMTVQCLDQADRPLVPATYVDRARALRGGTETGLTADPPSSGGTFLLPLGGTVLSPGEVDSIEVRFDVEVTAPAGLFRMNVPPGGVSAIDVTLSLPVAVTAEAGASFPLTSGLTQLESPARSLVVGFRDSMPAVLTADGSTVVFATLTLTNAAPATAGDITLDRLTVRAADRDITPVDIGPAIGSIAAWMDGSLWSDSGPVDPSDPKAMVPGATDIVLAPGAPRDVELRAVLRPGAQVPSLRLGFDAADIGVVQPSSQLLTIAVQAEEGQQFPFWTESGNFSAASLEESWSNFPNPFAAGREQTSFAFFLPQPGKVSLKLWTSRGKAVRTLLDATQLPAGLHQDRRWDGRNGRGEVVTNGVYLAEIAVQFDDGSVARYLRKVAVVR